MSENVQWIDDAAGLSACIAELKQAEELAIDLEFDKNLHRYGFNICLLQVFDGKVCYLIDPRSDQLEISDIFPVLEDPSIRKVVFTFGEDLRLLHSMGCFPVGLYDITVASRLLNYPQGSLAAILLEVLGVETSKDSQKSDWFVRPLPQEQLDYAAADVLYLLDAKKELETAAEKLGYTSWIAEENAVFDRVSFADTPSRVILKHKDKKDLTAYQLFILEGLLEFRESLGERFDKPSSKLAHLEYMKKIAIEHREMNRWHKTSYVHRLVRNPEVRAEAREELDKLRDEANRQKISRSEKAIKPIPRDEYRLQQQLRKKHESLKSKYFMPIKEQLAQDFGEHAVTYLLGNRLIGELVAGQTDNLREYKKEIFREAGSRLDIDVEPFLQGQPVSDELA